MTKLTLLVLLLTFLVSAIASEPVPEEELANIDEAEVQDDLELAEMEDGEDAEVLYEEELLEDYDPDEEMDEERKLQYGYHAFGAVPGIVPAGGVVYFGSMSRKFRTGVVSYAVPPPVVGYAAPPPAVVGLAAPPPAVVGLAAAPRQVVVQQAQPRSDPNVIVVNARSPSSHTHYVHDVAPPVHTQFVSTSSRAGTIRGYRQASDPTVVFIDNSYGANRSPQGTNRQVVLSSNRNGQDFIGYRSGNSERVYIRGAPP